MNAPGPTGPMTAPVWVLLSRTSWNDRCSARSAVEPGDVARQAAQAQPAPVATAAVPLPGGAAARLLVQPDGGGPEGGGGSSRARSTVTLRYESAGLGRVDLALTIEDGAVRAVAHAPAGEVAERLRAASPDLRLALASALARPAAVDIVAHAEVLDVSA